MGWLRPSHLFLVNYSERSSSMQKFLFFVFLLAFGDVALAYYKMGRIADAVTQLTRVHTEDPANGQAALLLGDCYLRMGQEKDVIRVLEPEESKRPDDLAIAYLLGTALIREKQVEKGQV